MECFLGLIVLKIICSDVQITENVGHVGLYPLIY